MILFPTAKEFASLPYISLRKLFADRAKEMLEQSVQERGHKIVSYYRENISGTKLERPELGRLLMGCHRNEIFWSSR